MIAAIVRFVTAPALGEKTADGPRLRRSSGARCIGPRDARPSAVSCVVCVLSVFLSVAISWTHSQRDPLGRQVSLRMNRTAFVHTL